MNNYRYIIYNTGYSSRKFGPCEICNKHVSEVWYQSEEREYARLPGDPPGTQWTHHECYSHFGHKKCLVSKRRNNIVIIIEK